MPVMLFYQKNPKKFLLGWADSFKPHTVCEAPCYNRCLLFYGKTRFCKSRLWQHHMCVIVCLFVCVCLCMCTEVFTPSGCCKHRLGFNATPGSRHAWPHLCSSLPDWPDSPLCITNVYFKEFLRVIWLLLPASPFLIIYEAVTLLYLISHGRI